MLLLIDAGNTRVKWALADPTPGAVAGRWLASGAVRHAGIDVLGERWVTASAGSVPTSPISHVLVANVAGAGMRQALEAQFRQLAAGNRPVTISWFASSGMLAGVRNGYREPARLGCDRFAALIGARALWPDRALIVATCGTATTVDALAADGHFIGGMILPGLGVMAASLAQRTAQLPAIEARLDEAGASARSPLFADDTDAAIRSGCLAAQAGAIERAVAAHDNAHCLLSGGAAAWVLPYLGAETTLVENLVLTGLHAVALESGASSHVDASGPIINDPVTPC